MFHRVVIDEGHEVLAEKVSSTSRNSFGDLLDGIQSQFRWYVSGSPFPEAWLSMIGALKFLQVWTSCSLANGLLLLIMTTQFGVYRVGRKKATGTADSDEAGADGEGTEGEADARKEEEGKDEESLDRAVPHQQNREFGPSIFQSQSYYSYNKRMSPLQTTLLNMIRERLYCRRDRESVASEAMIPPIVEEGWWFVVLGGVFGRFEADPPFDCLTVIMVDFSDGPYII